MNQRIKELAEQAKEHANSYDDAGTPIWFQFYNEKFAQLIVQECISTLMRPAIMEWGPGAWLELSEYNQGWVNGRLLGIEHINEHFYGVEP